MLAARLAPWKHRSMRFGLGALTVGVTTVFGVLRTKWLASHLGAEGLGVIGQITAAQTWIGLAAGLGLSIPLTRAVAAARGALDLDAERRAVATAVRLVATAALVAALAVLVAAPWLSSLLLATPAHAALVRLGALGVIGYAFHALAHGWFAGRADVRAPFTAALAGGIVSAAATLLLVPARGLAGGVLGAALLTPAAVLAAFTVHGRRYLGALRPLAPFSPDAARAMLAVGLGSLALSLTDQGVLLGTRAHFLRVQGVEANGLVQAGLALSQQLGAVFYFYLASYAFGTLSARPDLAAMRAYTRRQWIPLLALAALACALLMIAGGVLIPLFFSERFTGALPMLRWMLVGELARIAMQAWALGALPLAGVTLWVPLMLSFPLALAASYPVFLAHGARELSFAYAYATAGAVALASAGWTMTRRGLGLGARELLVLGVAVVGLAALAAGLGR